MKSWKDAERIGFHSVNEWKEANDDLDADQDCLRHGVVVVSRSRYASWQGGRDLGDDPARQHTFVGTLKNRRQRLSVTPIRLCTH